MGNVVQGDVSSSANVSRNLDLFLLESFSMSQSMWKVKLSSGDEFVFNLQYFASDLVLEKGIKVDDVLLRLFEFAVECTRAESCALFFLNKAEQSELLLCGKLRKKSFSDDAIRVVLCSLKERKILSDLRYAKAFLHDRALKHNEGRIRLFQELMKRCVSRKIVEEALDDFFSDKNEKDILCFELEKFADKCLSKNALCRHLLRKGFALSDIKKVLEIVNDTDD